MTNVLLLGDPKVGKSSWLRRLLSQGFTETYVTTIGKETEVLTYEGRKIIVHDIGGHERFAALTDLYYEVAHGAIVFYDHRRTRTTYWIEKLTKKVPGIPYIVVANKSDLTPDTVRIHRQISCKYDDDVHIILRDLLEKIPPVDEEITILEYIWHVLAGWLGYS